MGVASKTWTFYGVLGQCDAESAEFAYINHLILMNGSDELVSLVRIIVGEKPR